MRNPSSILLLISEENNSSELFSSAPVPWRAGGAEPLFLCQAGGGLWGWTPNTCTAQTPHLTDVHTAQGSKYFCGKYIWVTHFPGGVSVAGSNLKTKRMSLHPFANNNR